MTASGLSGERAAAAEAALSRLDGEAAAEVKPFLSAWFQPSATGELDELDGNDIARIALLLSAQQRYRRPGETLVSIEPVVATESVAGRRRTRLVVINDDTPFIVDSVVSELSGRGLAMDCLLHPVVDVTRDAEGKACAAVPAQAGVAPAPDAVRESVIYVEFEPTTARARTEIKAALEEVLADVRRCVAGWRPMLADMQAAIEDLRQYPPREGDAQEAIAFLEWLCADNFTFLGSQVIDYGDRDAPPTVHPGHGLLTDPNYPLWRGMRGVADLPPQLSQFLHAAEPILITKANAMSHVHRRVHLDYIAVKRFDGAGQLVGERRFVGLFTSTAYATNPRTVPVLRGKVQQVIARCGFDPRSHAGKALVHVLEQFPRDELFQIDVDLLERTAIGLLSLMDRPRPKLFVRHDRFERHVSILVYVPRDIYRADLRKRIGDMLQGAYHAPVAMFSVRLDDDSLARVHFILATDPGKIPDISTEILDAQLTGLVRGWDDQLELTLEDRFGAEAALRLTTTYGKLFSPSYRAQFSAIEAAQDIGYLTSLASPAERGVHIYKHIGDRPDQLRVKIYRLGEIIPLSEAVPLLEAFGLTVMEEYPFDLDGGALGWIHDFLVTDRGGQPIDLEAVGERLRAAVEAVLEGRVENDGFHALVLSAGLTHRQISWLRAYSRYLRQTGLAYEAETVYAALRNYPRQAAQLVALFEVRFSGTPDSAAQEQQIVAAFEDALTDVSALDDDRILRRFLAAIRATVRTNAFQDPEPEALAFKIRSAEMPDLPPPVPYMEIFVHSPRVEGIHLRGGKVARGGLRWSDRRDDFRTEILSLLKAQMVKNAVIVPVGAKGGFFPKQLPPPTDREAFLTEGREAYKVFVRTLLSVTDNRVGEEIVPPTGVVRLDGDDPYFVVAADKGTATFSDTANAISLDAGFWLGDAFASGGSQGYDHKKMGITARGAWISVERHFREMGVNVAVDPIDVIGVGDMSGDVFGNGMLLSRAIRLVAAFDHRHIFLDPNPNPEASFAERQRMFDLPRSSWADYNPGLISPGGGVFPRSAKEIPLSPEIRAMLGIADAVLDPITLMSAILKAPVDLLWLGGIGTYVKASDETHAQAGDKTNDAVRVDAGELRVKVIGEGANLGVTQAGRIEFARRGGRINTDFIDNSAGVDCSDNEVNIKILLDPIMSAGRMTQDVRNDLLVSMTDDVGAIVLRDNYLQTQAISVAQAAGLQALPAQLRFMQRLEQSGHLNRKVEGLPTDAQVTTRQLAGEGLTRPELAVLLSYAKINIFEQLLDSAVPDDPRLVEDLEMAFPQVLVDRFANDMRTHRLRRELIATKLANAIVNRGGITLAYDLAEEAGREVADVASAFVLTREAYDMRNLWRLIDSYDYQIPAEIQTALHLDAARALRLHMEDVLRYAPRLIGADTPWLRDGISSLRRQLLDLLADAPREEYLAHQQRLAALGAPLDVAEQIAQLAAMDGGVGVVLIAHDFQAEPAEVAHAYGLLGEALMLGWAHGAAKTLAPADPWERLLAASVVSDFERIRLTLIEQLCKQGGQPPLVAVKSWLSTEEATVLRVLAKVKAVRASEPVTTAKLTHLANQVRLLLG